MENDEVVYQEPAVIHELDADRIIPRLWQGAYPAYNMKAVKKHFDVLVLCADELLMDGKDALYPTIKILRTGLDDCRPVRDGDLEKASAMAVKVAEAYKAGKRILVTCAAGLNRSGLVTALALKLIEGKSGTECVAMVQKARRHALYNRDFEFYVCSY